MPRVAPWLKAFNVVMAPTVANRRGKVDKIIDRAVRDAESEIDTTASGDERFIEEMRRLLECFADVEDLTAVGWTVVAAEIASRIENRLRIRKLHALHPEVGDERIERPVVVVGLPRTATSLVHRSLASSRHHRAPLLWELLHTDLDEPGAAGGYREWAEQFVNGSGRVHPELQQQRRFAANEPEECVFVLPHGVVHLLRAPLPRYEQWILDRDFTADYQYLKRALQVLQHGRPRRRWILKSPAHLWNLNALLQVFPDAQIVWSHRDPAEAMASLCALAETDTAAHVRQPDPHRIGRQWLGLLATGLGRAQDALRDLPNDSVIHVPYRRLTEQPEQVMPDLFAGIGTEWGDAEREALDRLAAERRQQDADTADLARYGLTETDADGAFGEYRRYVASMT